MDLKSYRERKQQLQQTEDAKYRSLCVRCLQPTVGCYCSVIKAFDPEMKFVVLIHPIEVRRRIATGRMSHLCLKNSALVMGQDYSNNYTVNKILNDPAIKPVILYPGPGSVNLTKMTQSERADINPDDKKLAVIVIDGTWATARKMMRLSTNLHHLPKICFTPPGPSRFRVRKQPGEICYSTIEAIHHTIDLLGPSQGFDVASRAHDTMITTFDYMVERQIAHIEESNKLRVNSRHFRSKEAARATRQRFSV